MGVGGDVQGCVRWKGRSSMIISDDDKKKIDLATNQIRFENMTPREIRRWLYIFSAAFVLLPPIITAVLIYHAQVMP